MVSVNKTHDIGKIYQHSQTGAKAAPPPGEERPTAVMPVDRVTLSRHALNSARPQRSNTPVKNEQDLSAEEQEVVQDLKRRDAEVKAHEQAHMAAGAGVASGGATYQYQTGPDGKMYAVGGEVKIDVSPEGSPDATIRKMQQIQAAALAPAQPSGQDRAVAAQAAQVEAMARMEKSQQKEEASAGPGANPPAIEADTANRGPQSDSPPGRQIDLMV